MRPILSSLFLWPIVMLGMNRATKKDGYETHEEKPLDYQVRCCPHYCRD